jgi:hypothetical protein
MTINMEARAKLVKKVKLVRYEKKNWYGFIKYPTKLAINPTIPTPKKVLVRSTCDGI